MATETGVNVTWGVPTARQAGTGYTTEGADYGEECELKELKDETGETKTVVTWDNKQTLTLDVYPSGVTPGTCPTSGQIITVGGSTTYMCLTAREANTNTGEQKITMNLKRWGTNVTLT